MQAYVDQETPPVTPRKCGVLVAEDEPAIREMLHSGLQREGFAVWVAADGQEALDVYRGHRETIDVVLLDVRMPRLDGPTTLVAIQSITPQIPCCFMSGFLGHYTEAALHHYGARAIVKKPFRTPELARVLRSVVSSEAPAGVMMTPHVLSIIPRA